MTVMLFSVWSLAVMGATPLRSGAPPMPNALIPSWFSLPTMPAQTLPSAVVQAQAITPADRFGLISLGPSAPGSPSQPQVPLDICPVIQPASCNTVVRFDTREGAVSQPVWNDYNCVNHSVFPAGSLAYSETGYSFSVAGVSDVSLAVPLVMSDGFTSMNVFAGLFTDCNTTSCIAGSENKQLIMYRHAIELSASPGTYTSIIDSDNMSGFGDMIIACGNPNAGWCSSAYTADITCNDYTINGTTDGGPDNIIYYDTPYWVDNYAFDGAERVYRIVVSQKSIYSFTLHYTGSYTLPYNNYMSYFLFDETCDQRDVWDGPAPPSAYLVGEGGAADSTQSIHLMYPGTYYLVVDGMHLPTEGDDFQLDVQCAEVNAAYLPLAMQGFPPSPGITADPTSGPDGTTFYFTGVDFWPNEDVSDWFVDTGGNRYDLSGITANSQGMFIRSLYLYGGWPVGKYTYYAEGAISQQTASVNFWITASAHGGGTGRSFSASQR